MRGWLSTVWSGVRKKVCSTRVKHRSRRHNAAAVVSCFLLMFYMYTGRDAVSEGDTPSKAKTVLIVSYKNAGSNVIGRLLQQLPDTFYQPEPLQNLELDSRDGLTIRFLNGTQRRLVPYDLDTALTTELSHHIINCRHEQLDISSLSVYYYSLKSARMRDTSDYFKCHGRQWRKETLVDFPETRSTFINSIMKEEAEARIIHCLPLLTDKCKAARVRVFEFTQMQMTTVSELLEHSDDVKVIYLIRDPRAIIEPLVKNEEMDSEKTQLLFLQTKDVCLKMLEDLYKGAALKEKYPDRFVAIRYEDLIDDPDKNGETIFKFVDPTRTDELVEHKKGSDLYTPPSDTLWRERVEPTHLTIINDLCSEIYEKAGYIRYDEIDGIRNLDEPTYVSVK